MSEVQECRSNIPIYQKDTRQQRLREYGLRMFLLQQSDKKQCPVPHFNDPKLIGVPMKRFLVILVLAALFTSPHLAIPGEARAGDFGHKLLFYLPNRVCDVFDVVRARVRVGPGFALGARVTKYGEISVHAYTSVFAGLHGPRTEPRIPWPVGIESRAGVAAVADVSTETTAPTYGYGEVGLGFHAGIVGLDVGADPVELLDLALGFLFIDLTGDDF